jgi:hypothetical protein
MAGGAKKMMSVPRDLVLDIAARIRRQRDRSGLGEFPRDIQYFPLRGFSIG